MRNVSSGLCSPVIHYVVAKDSSSGQWRPWSDCANAQSDLGHRCPHMQEDKFSHGTAQISLKRRCEPIAPIKTSKAPGIFFAILTGSSQAFFGHFCDFLFTLLYTSPFWKGDLSELPPLKVYPFLYISVENFLLQKPTKNCGFARR